MDDTDNIVMFTTQKVIERFVILMYERTSECMDVDEARKDLFPAKNGQIEKVPPTQAALLQHLKRAMYQGSICWGQALELDPTMPSP